MLTLLGKLKSGFTTALLFLVAALGATILLMRNQRTKAKQTIKNVKRDLTASETMRESEKIIQEALHKTRNQANETEQNRQERKATDDRPEQFGDPRINDGLHQRTRDTSSKGKS